jgi:hypothetical protein
MPLIFYVLILFVLLQILSLANYRLLVNLNILKHTIFFGIFLHEFSHYLACKLTFAPVKKMSVGRKGGYVIHGSSRIPLLGNMIISLAPLFIGLLALVFIIYLLVGDKNLFFSIISAIKAFNWQAVYVLLKTWFVNTNFVHWKFWLLIFLFLNIVVVITPSKKDYTNILFGILIYIILSYYFSYFDIVNTYLINALILANILILMAILILLILNIIKKIIVFL